MKRCSVFFATLVLCGVLTSEEFRPRPVEASCFTETLSGEKWTVEMNTFEGMISIVLPYEADGYTVFSELREGQVQIRVHHPQIFTDSIKRNRQSRTIATLYMATPVSGRVLIHFDSAA